MLLKNFVVFLALLLSISASGGGSGSDSSPLKEDPHSLSQYKYTDNPLDNLHYCYEKAKSLAGNDVVLYAIEGVQKTEAPSDRFDFIWTWHFFSENKHLVFDTKAQNIKEIVLEEPLMGYEAIREGDPRILNSYPIKDIWNDHIKEYSTPIKYASILIPLYYPPSNMQYRLSTKEGEVQLGLDYFPYDADTKEKIWIKYITE